MNRIYPYSCRTTKCDTGEVVLDEKFDLRLSASASEKELELIELANKYGGVHWGPILPENWASLTHNEKVTIIESTEFDIKVDGIYFRYEVSLEDIKKITKYPEIDGLHIHQNTLTNEDVQHLTCFINLDHLRLRGVQFTDDVIKYLSVFKLLTNLDIFETSITKNGVKKIKKILPRCSIWGP